MCRCFCSSVPYSSSVGPNMETPMPPIGLRAPMRFISSASTRASIAATIRRRRRPWARWERPSPSRPSACARPRPRASRVPPIIAAIWAPGLSFRALGKFLPARTALRPERPRRHRRNPPSKELQIKCSYEKNGRLKSRAENGREASLLWVGKAQNPLGNHVEIDLRGAPFDRVGLGAQPAVDGGQLRPPRSRRPPSQAPARPWPRPSAPSAPGRRRRRRI